MSTWTHINASIRFDGIFQEELPTEKDLGKMCKWEDEDYSHWDNAELPCGSEGSIEYRIIKNEIPDCLATMVVVFYGDLRDYDDIEEVLSYFIRITNGRFIRSGILEIVVGDETQVFKYENKQWNLI